MALVCAQLIASSGLNQPVKAVETTGEKTDHTYVVIGDGSEERVIADPWAMFSKAMLEKNFHYRHHDHQTLHRFTPREDASVRANLYAGGIVDHDLVDREFASKRAQLGGLSDRELMKLGIEKDWIYDEFHTSDNLGETYRYRSSSGDQYIDQNLSREEYQRIYNGPSPTPRSTASTNYPPTSSARFFGQSAGGPSRSRRSSFSGDAGLAEPMRRMSMSDSPRCYSLSGSSSRPVFTAPAPAPAPSRRYSMSGTSRPTFTTTTVTPAASSERRERRLRHRTDRLPERSSGSFFSSMFRRS